MEQRIGIGAGLMTTAKGESGRILICITDVKPFAPRILTVWYPFASLS